MQIVHLGNVESARRHWRNCHARAGGGARSNEPANAKGPRITCLKTVVNYPDTALRNLYFGLAQSMIGVSRWHHAPAGVTETLVKSRPQIAREDVARSVAV